MLGVGASVMGSPAVVYKNEKYQAHVYSYYF
jgi:hypothetical protein